MAYNISNELLNKQQRLAAGAHTCFQRQSGVRVPVQRRLQWSRVKLLAMPWRSLGKLQGSCGRLLAVLAQSPGQQESWKTHHWLPFELRALLCSGVQ